MLLQSKANSRAGPRRKDRVERAAQCAIEGLVGNAGEELGRGRIDILHQGDGIAPAERERVLVPFYRLDKARTPGEAASGFGLGLTLASRVAQVHRGAISIGPAESVGGSDRGCRVTLTLPIAPAGVP